MLKKNLLILSVALLTLSCRKNDSPVGTNLLPQSDIISGGYVEFIPDISYSHYRSSDSILLTTRLSNSCLLGSMNDPVFGRTDASIYCSFETPYYPGSLNGTIDMSTKPELDSAVLILGYNYTPGSSTAPVGDTSDQLSLDIFPVKYNLSPDTNYYSTGNNYYYTGTGSLLKGPIPYDATKSLIYEGSKTFSPHLLWYAPIKKDTTAYDPPQLRVRLRDDFGEGLFACVNNNTQFQQYLKGMFITTKHSILPQPSYGSIFFVYMDGNTSINFYFHTKGVAAQQPPLKFYCNGSTCTNFSYLKHDYHIASPDLQNQINHPDTLATNNHYQNVYLQGGAGVGVVLKFPDLLAWANSNIYNVTINKAELVLNTDRSNLDFYNLGQYPLPGRVFLEGDTLGGPRGLVENLYTFGGYYDLTNNQYLIEIPHTVGQIVTGRTLNTKFYLTVYNGALFPERLVLGGTSNKDYPIKLRVWYTKLTSKR